MLFYTLLFILLSPGFFLTIPPVGKSVLMSGQTSFTSVIVHAVIYTAILYAVANKREGFNPSWGVPNYNNIQIAAALCGGLGLGFLLCSQGLTDYSLYMAFPCLFITLIMLAVTAYGDWTKK